MQACAQQPMMCLTFRGLALPTGKQTQHLSRCWQIGAGKVSTYNAYLRPCRPWPHKSFARLSCEEPPLLVNVILPFLVWCCPQLCWCSAARMHTWAAWLCTAGVAATLLASIRGACHAGLVRQELGRKLMHIRKWHMHACPNAWCSRDDISFCCAGMGTTFVMCWPLFGDSWTAALAAASIPFAATLHFIAVGLGITKDAGLVSGTTVRVPAVHCWLSCPAN